MRLNLTLSKKALILVSVPLIFELTFVTSLAFLLQQAEHEREHEAHARDITTHVNNLLRLLIDAGTGIGAYTLMKSSVFKEHYRRSMDKVPAEFETLKELVKDHPREREAIAEIERLEQQGAQCLNVIKHLLEKGDRVAAVQKYGELRYYMRAISAATDKIIAEQQSIQKEKRLAQSRFRYQIQSFLLIGVIFNIFLAVFLALYFNKGTTQRLKVLMDNTVRLSQGKPLNPPLTGADEIAHLDRVFNEMANALAEAHRKERAVIENAMDVICSFDSAGKFTAVNQASLKVFGYLPEELIGVPCLQLVIPEDIKRSMEAIQQVTQGEPSLSFENRVTRKDGSTIDILWSLQWSEAEKTLFCVAHDISERKAIERMKQDFVAMVSHDLRTPLTSIQGFLTLLSVGSYGQLSESGKNTLSIASSNVSRLIALINDLLDIEKMEAGKLEIYPAEYAVSALFRRTLEAVSGFANQQGVELQVIPSQANIYADSDRLVQVLVNLIANAIKFSPKGGCVVVSAAEETDWVEIRVQDQGPGIPPAAQETIFERFQQINSASGREHKGSGLGLTICRTIVERHGGKIGVLSQEAQGSNFWFRIPKQRSQI